MKRPSRITACLPRKLPHIVHIAELLLVNLPHFDPYWCQSHSFWACSLPALCGYSIRPCCWHLMHRDASPGAGGSQPHCPASFVAELLHLLLGDSRVLSRHRPHMFAHGLHPAERISYVPLEFERRETPRTSATSTPAERGRTLRGAKTAQSLGSSCPCSQITLDSMRCPAILASSQTLADVGSSS